MILTEMEPSEGSVSCQSPTDLALLLPSAESAQREDGRLPPGKPFPTRCGIYPCLHLGFTTLLNFGK